MGPGSTSTRALTSTASGLIPFRAQLSTIASVTHEASPRRAVSTGSIRSSAPSTPSASPTSFHDPSWTEKSRVGLSMTWPPRLHRPTFPRLPSPRPSHMDRASSPSLKLSGDVEYSLLKASI